MKKQSINNGELQQEFPPFQINDVSADYDMNIVLLYDACGLLKAQEEE